MTLFKLKSGGFFATDSKEALPAELVVRSATEIGEVLLDGLPIPTRCEGGEGVRYVLPASLRYGAHTLTVDGVYCEGLSVHEGCVKPAGLDVRRVLGAILRLESLEARLLALEKKQNKKEVNWLL